MELLIRLHSIPALAEVVESTIYVTAKDNVSAAALDNILNDEQIMVKKGRPNVHVMLTRIWQQNPPTPPPNTMTECAVYWF